MKSIGLPVSSHVSDNGQIYLAVKDGLDYLAGVFGCTPKEAVRRLKREVVTHLREVEKNDRNIQRSIVVCKDGTLLLVEYRNAWTYRIAGRDRKGGSCSIFPEGSTFSQIMEAAQRHAESAYGGVDYVAPL